MRPSHLYMVSCVIIILWGTWMSAPNFKETYPVVFQDFSPKIKNVNLLVALTQKIKDYQSHYDLFSGDHEYLDKISWRQRNTRKKKKKKPQQVPSQTGEFMTKNRIMLFFSFVNKICGSKEQCADPTLLSWQSIRYSNNTMLLARLKTGEYFYHVLPPIRASQ